MYCFSWMIAILVWPVSVLRLGTVIRDALRTRRYGLQTAVVTYTRPADWKRVVMVGAMHVADREYFEKLRDFVAAEESAADGTVLYEAMRDADGPPPDDDRSPAATLERGFAGLRDLYRYMAANTGRAMQYDILRPRAGWINTDMTRREVAKRSAETWLIRFLSTTGILDAIAKAIGLAGGVPKPPARPDFAASFQMDISMRATHLSIPLNALLTLLPKRATPLHTIVNERNEAAVEGILEALTRTDNVVSIWGAAHLPGIGRLLKRCGFAVTRRNVKWLTCCRFRRYGLWDIVKYIFTGRFRTE